MMSRMLGAPFGGTTCGGQYGLESLASRPIAPPNGDGGFGRYRPSIVVVALGEPGTPVVSCALATGDNAVPTKNPKLSASKGLFMRRAPSGLHERFAWSCGSLMKSKAVWPCALEG